ncbi:protein kinase activating protein dpb11 [Neophaeococcomyces mojaviensis]|uniref:Protein kinase activating protein dpb11 n=1 Tax=Neophaeococcomyces mojaviensis TaxID=3383035 RepID=A0ACC2ZXK0_9EURO|nr:protein kinase activating protein dpb11 [Knufia sp. JES_112]
MPRNTSKLSAEKPLEGAVLCCTSILPEDRTQLAEWAQEMGAEHTLDLTSDVTHLLVGDTDSKKYQYVAKEREDVKVLKPEWVQAVREIWMADQPLNLNALEAEYRVPTLFGLKICITGFDDMAFRNGLAQDIQKNGGTYTGDLTKDVTHLIAAAPVGKKFEYATMWQVKIVSIKWYKDTVDRGMQLDESLYHPAMQPEQQGIGAWNRRKPSSPKLGKRQREDQPTTEPGRKLRRTASARFSNQHENLWNDIVGNNDPVPDVTEYREKVLRPSKSMPVMHPDQTEKNPPDHKGEERVAGILHGKHFSTRGFDEQRRTLLYSALAGLGAMVHESISQMLKQPDVDPQDQFLIVPYTTDEKILNVLTRKCPNVTLVTELWVEWCITKKHFVSPDQYVLGRPISPIVLPAASKLVVNASGFHQVQTMHISKIVSQFGAQYQETFTPETTVLVCNSANVNPQKIIHAQLWEVPIVTEKWLEQLAKDGRVPSFEPFRVGQNRKAGASTDATAQGASVHQRRETATTTTTTENLARPQDGQGNDTIDGDNFANAPQDNQVLNVSTPDGNHTSVTEATEPPEGFDGKSNSPEEDSIKIGRWGLPEQPNKPKPLQEISSNIQGKRPSPMKKKLFRAFDGYSSIQDETVLPQQEEVKEPGVVLEGNEDNALDLVSGPELQPQIQSEKEKQNELMKEFFEIKAAAAAKAAEVSKKQSSRPSKKKNLLGRALSNLSNSSRTSNDNSNNHSNDAIANGKQPLSRASSINSVNTDGLGVPLSGISRLPTEGSNGIMACPKTNNNTRYLALKDNASRDDKATALKQPTGSTNLHNSSSTLTSFQAQLLAFTTSQPTRPASPPPRSQDQGQLTYADTAEATKLKAQLAEKRRARARFGQQPNDSMPELSKEESEEQRQQEWREMERAANERGVLKDDEALIGGGRRTRGRDKALAGLEGARDGDGQWGAGLPI